MTHKKAVLVESQNLRVSVDCWEQSLSSVYQVRNRDTVGRNKTGPVLVPPDASSVLNIGFSCGPCTKPVHLPGSHVPLISYSNSLYNSFPIFQLGNIKYAHLQSFLQVIRLGNNVRGL